MSSLESPEIDIFIERAVAMLQADATLFPSGYPPTAGDNLVTDILAQEPPIDQSANDAPVPMIYVGYSKNPIRRMDYIGRDERNAAGARTYYLEFYNVIIAREITKEASQKTCQVLSKIVRDVFQNNTRMVNPVDPDDFIATTNEVIAVPFSLRSSNPAIYAINVNCRPQQQVSLTE